MMIANKKHLFIDMDATICDYISPEGKVIITDFNRPGIFINKRPIYIVIEAITELFPIEEFQYHILSASPGEIGDTEKHQWLDTYFPIPYGERHLVRYPNEDKASYIYQWCTQNDIDIRSCTLLDDTQRHLKEAEQIGITACHPAHLVCEFEKKKELTNSGNNHILVLDRVKGFWYK